MKRNLLKMGLLAGGMLLASSGAQAAEIFYQGGFSNNLYKYDTATNVETLVGVMGLSADSTGMAFSSSGTLYAFDRGSTSLYTVNTTTGATTLIGNSGIAAEDLTIALDGSRGYVTANGNLYSLNLLTGAATVIGATSVQDGLTTARNAVTVNGNNYAAGQVFGVDSRSMYAINTATGAATFIGGINGADETFDFGSDNVLYGHDDNGHLTTTNLATLVSTNIFTTTPQLVFGMAVRPGAVQPGVPEPATWAMLILGFGLIGGSMRVRRARVTYA